MTSLFSQVRNRTEWQRFRLWLGFAVLACLTFSAELKADETEEREHGIIAGFLVNFFSYVEWPQEAGNGTGGPLLLGIAGDSAYNSVSESLKSKTVNGRRIEVRKVDDLNNLTEFQVVFISASEGRRQRQILERTRNSAVLTVGQAAGFLDEGGVINLVPVHDKFKFDINRTAADKAHLKISLPLLKLSRRIIN